MTDNNEKISYGFADHFGFTSPFGGNSIFSQQSRDKEAPQRASQEKQKTLSELPDVTLECVDLKYLPIKTKIPLRFKVGGISSKGLGGKKYNIKITCNSSTVTLTTDEFTAENGWILITNIDCSIVCEVILQIEIDKTKKNTIHLTFLESKDVFSKSTIDKVINELLYVQDYSTAKNNEPLLPEYSSNYCMSAAERGLSELLGDSTNFYSVQRVTHHKKNKITFAPGLGYGENGKERAKKFEQNGYIQKFDSLTKISQSNKKDEFNNFDRYIINQKQRKLINDSQTDAEVKVNYSTVKYTIIDLSEADKIFLWKAFETDIKRKELGYHVYYFSVTDDFHVLLLIINNVSPCDSTYEIWDQHGKTSSSGNLKEIGEGLRKQTSWTFANTCLNRCKVKLQNPSNLKIIENYDSTTTRLWKIQKK